VPRVSDRTAERIFGTRYKPVNLTEVGRRIGRSKSTLSGWKHRPETIKLYDFARIAKVTGMTDSQIVEVVRGIK